MIEMTKDIVLATIALGGLILGIINYRRSKRLEKRSYAIVVCDAAKSLIRTASSEPRLHTADVAKFNEATRDLKVHFPKKVNDYIHSLYLEAIDLERVQSLIEHKSHTNQAEYEDRVNKENAARERISQQIDVVDELLKKYLC
jgi:hypothetical protein